MLKGFSIISRRCKTKVGEIDITAKSKNVTIICEVKARNDFESAAYSLSDNQKKVLEKRQNIICHT